MFLAKLSINRPVMITMFISVFIVFGILAYLSLPLNLMPNIEIPFITIQTVYPGAGPQEIESQITRPVEDAVSTVSNIDFIQSYSMENASFVLIRFDFSEDTDVAYQEVKENVDAILAQLPSGADMPIVGKFDITAMPIIDMVFSANVCPTELYDYADSMLRDRFSQIDGVANVNITGGEVREIQIRLDPADVERYSISLTQLSQIIAAHNMDMPGGQFQHDGQEFSVRLVGELQDLEALRDLEIPTRFGQVKLNRLAQIEDTNAEVRERSVYYNVQTGERQEDVINISLVASPEGNVVEISNQIQSLLPQIRDELPAGFSINIARDNAFFIEDTFHDTMNNILLGILLTGLVLLLFLADLRSTFIVALAMPTSIISSLILLQMFDFSLNLMTLMGFSVSVGILVTNSVVVLENIFRHKSMGHGRKKAAELGTSEIAVAVIASTMTNIVVFLPIATMSSMVGQFFTEFALAVTFATIFSLLISFTLTPMLASLILPEKENNSRLSKVATKSFRKWEQLYKKTLKTLLKKKRYSASLLAGVIILFVLSLFLAAAIGFEFMPFSDEGNISVEIELPQGYDLNETAQLLQEIDNRIAERPEIDQMIATLGSIGRLEVGANLARIRVRLVDTDQRRLTTRQVADQIARSLSDIPNATIRVFAVSSMGGGGGSPIEFYLMGPDMDELTDLTENMMEHVGRAEGLTNFNTSLRPGNPQLTFIPRMDKLASAGLTVFDLSMSLRSSIEGVVATQYREAGREYDIKVSLMKESVDTPQKIANIPIVAPTGTYKLSQLADLDFSETPSVLLRRDKILSVEFTGDVATGYPLGTVVNNIENEIEELDIPSGYSIIWGGEGEMMQETIADMLQTFILAILLTYMLLAALLESFLQPLFILATLPFALIGVFAAMFVVGLTMNIVSMMSIIMLVGIVVNNAILLLDYTNQLVRREGMPVKEALITACPTKLRPIVMSSFAIILGMAPMAAGLGAAGRELRQPMGIVSIGGLIVSMLLALFVIPSLYNLFIKTKN